MDPNQTAPSGSTLFAIPSAFFWTQCLVKPHSSTFSIITAVVFSASFFSDIFTVKCTIYLDVFEYISESATIMILSFWIDMSGQTVQIQIRLLL